MSLRNLAWLLIVPALVLTGFVVSAYAPPPENDYQLVRTIVDVLAEVDKNYYRQLTDEEKKQLVENMINGGLQQLDQHSMYFNEQTFERFETQTEGQFAGVGIRIYIDPKTEKLMVENSIVGSPAFDAGILPGDIIQAVDGTPTQGLKLDDVIAKIKGKIGTTVKMTVLHSNATEPVTLEVTRAMIKLESLQGFARDPANPTKWNYFADAEAKIAMVRLTAFTEKSGDEMAEVLKAIKAAGAKALIFDMRGNPGGLLSQAVTISDYFLNEGSIVSTQDRSGITSERTASADTTLLADLPVLILVDGNSASASEIVAAALQENGRAKVMGQRSFGKGSVQKIFNLSNPKTALKLTTEIWKTPKGRSIDKKPGATPKDDWGIRPDDGLEVKMTDQEMLQYWQSLRALDRADGKLEIKEGDPKPDDKVLREALKYLRNRLEGKAERFNLIPRRGVA